MMEITVVNKHHWLPNGREAIYIGRPSPLGNPYRMHSERDREYVIKKYEEWLWGQHVSIYTRANNELLRILEIARKKDVVLVCFCKPKPCHGDFVKYMLTYMGRIK